METLEFLNSRNARILLYIYENGGEVIGFRDLSIKMRMGYHTLKDGLRDLRYFDLLTKEVGPNNVSIYRLTDKGKKAAELLKQLIDVLEE